MVTSRIIKMLLLLMVFSGCLKDDTEISSLNTNPLDPDYTGPSYITVVRSQAEVIGTAPPIQSHAMDVEVNSSVFPAGTDYRLNVKNLTTGTETQLIASPPGSDFFTYNHDDINLGQEYCYEFSVWVNFSIGRADTFCDTL